MNANEITRAGCLTPPGPGGVAVVQVVGVHAPALVAPHLRSKRPLLLEQLAPDELRLCRFVDHDEIIDDVLVCARREAGGEWVIDLNLHGGPRIVQRALMLLQKAGAAILPGVQLAHHAMHARDVIEREAIELLRIAQTRPVVQWLLRLKDELPRALNRCQDLLTRADLNAARQLLVEMTSHTREVRWLIQGARLVVVGRPNAGKSTLVNALADREQILVSDVPGTTRDYVEQPAAVEGVPVTLVDTAGIRATDDPLEREAIARARAQIMTADLILHVVDASAPPDAENDPDPFFSQSPHRPARLLIWNKIDQPLHPDRVPTSEPVCSVSAASGMGLSTLRGRILDQLELTAWSDRFESTFTPRQQDLLRRALDQLDLGITGARRAASLVRECRDGSKSADASPSDAI